MILSNTLVGVQMEYQLQLLALPYTVLIVNELVMIALEINTWHVYMIDGEIASLACYFISVPFLGDYFRNFHCWRSLIKDVSYFITLAFFWKTLLILAVSLGPPWALKALRRRIKPPNYARLQEV